MNEAQRAAAERLANALEGQFFIAAAPQAAALLRELLAEPVINQQMTTELAEPVQEPVAWGVFVDDELFKPFNCKDEAVDWFQAQYNHGSRYDYLVLPLYAAPQQPMHCPEDGGKCGAGGYCRPEPQGEPVAWLYESTSGSSFLHRGFTKVRFEADMRASKEYPDGHTMTPLYTHPPQRQPLSDEQITALVREAAKGSAIRRDGSTSHRIARAIERAHGIGEPT